MQLSAMQQLTDMHGRLPIPKHLKYPVSSVLNVTTGPLPMTLNYVPPKPATLLGAIACYPQSIPPVRTLEDPIGLVLRREQVLVTRLRPKMGVRPPPVLLETLLGPCRVMWVTTRSRMLWSLTGLLLTTVLEETVKETLLRTSMAGTSSVMMQAV